MSGGGGGEEAPSAPNPLAAQTGGLLPRKPLASGSDFDITAMIDLVFMMNIYFLVTTLTALAGDLDLPRASHVVPVDDAKSTMISIVLAADGKTAIVTIGDDESKGKMTEPEEQVEKVKQAVKKGIDEKKTDVVLRAERGVRLKDVSRIAGAAGKVEGAKLFVAVLETDNK